MGDRRYARICDEEIAAAMGEELPDREELATLANGSGPEEFGLAADSAADRIPPGRAPQPQPDHPHGPAAPEEES
jgi:hypothetical protein